MKPETMLCVCLVLVIAPTCLIARAGSAEAEVIALEKSWNYAELRHDPAALARLMSDDLVLTEPDGSVIGKGEEVAFTADPDAHFEILESEDMKVRVHGNVAVATGAYHEKGTFRGKSFEHRGRFTDTWVRDNGTLRCVAGHFSVSVKD